MPITVYNSLTRKKEPLEPVHPGKVGIYLCGPTVYKPSHIGHAVGPIIFDAVKRYLVHRGYEVTWVVNITDVDDKLIVEAESQGVTTFELAERITGDYFAAMDALHVDTIDIMPKASEHIGDIIAIIQKLIDKEIAYASNGDVYFDVTKDPDYGKLSNRRAEEQETGRRDLKSGEKRNPGDFALWKAAKPQEPDEVKFDSPWGRGRPGWHIECSAMAEKVLGLDFEVHGGGSDLVFPHHENEIAQTEAARDRPLARIWMHNGMVRFGEEKMAKSVGNVTTLADALDRHGRDALVLFLLGGHYRQPLSFSDERMDEAAQAVRRLVEFNRLLGRAGELAGGDRGPEVDALRDEFFAALRDDFNTPQALAALFKLVSEGNRRLGGGEPLPGAAAAFAELLGVLGLETLRDRVEEVDEEALRLLGQREDARRSRDFTRADEVRDELRARGWVVRDTPEGPVLVPAE
jgi:cysteinyl-tRNA synthetase